MEKNLKRVNILIKEENHILAKLISTLKKTTLNEYYEQAVRKAISRDKERVRRIIMK